MLQEHFYEEYTEESDEWERFDTAMDVWATSLKRELQKRLDTNQVMEATAQIVEITPDIDLRMKLDYISVNALLADFGESVHIAKVNDHYVTVIESDSILFEKGFSPIEFLKPDELEMVLERIRSKRIGV